MSASSDPSVGSELLGYRIEELIGRGGMGVVFRALDRARPPASTTERIYSGDGGTATAATLNAPSGSR